VTPSELSLTQVGSQDGDDSASSGPTDTAAAYKALVCCRTARYLRDSEMIAGPLSLVDEPAVGAIYTIWRTRTHSEPRDEERAEQQAVNGLRLRPVEARLTDPFVDSTGLHRVQFTQRQRMVLQLISRGHSNKRIAQALNIAPETVKSHVKTIFAKLGTQSRTVAVVRAIVLGSIGADARW
jgi:DNA-binding CsgD family transcriptional regulator